MGLGSLGQGDGAGEREGEGEMPSELIYVACLGYRELE